MHYLDRATLIRNIKFHMRKNGMTQNELAKILNMSQPNISKALNENGDKYFTLEQVYGMAKHFRVTMDSLIGDQQSMNKGPTLSRRDIATFITKCIQEGFIVVTDMHITEEVYVPESPQSDFCGFFPQKVKVPYPFFHFPDHWSPDESATSEMELAELTQEACSAGNETQNVPINNFIRNFMQIHQAHKHKHISPSVYDTVVQDLLSHVPEI